MNDEDTIIYNELPLTEAFIPTRLFHREGQLRIGEMYKASSTQPTAGKCFLSGLVGSTGTGKRIVAKWVLESYFPDRSVCVNCWKYRSTHDVLEIVLGLKMVIHGREKTSYLMKIFERIVKEKKIIVCLHEVDQLKESNILYVLARNACARKKVHFPFFKK